MVDGHERVTDNNKEGRDLMITLTPPASQALQGMIKQQELPATTALRVGITREGCEGSGTQFAYVLAFDPDPPGPSDRVFETEGLTIVVDHDSLSHLNGLQLDVRQEFGGVKFLFRNPRAKHSCGCGHTFSEEEPAPE
ncbi:MAG: iron-sulfur cluster assembly accessory protein [Armatimonadetes bacterium]|nr:iron-sulfur cluster assembly accessory protein [Armatimonadota bacterium]